jgi:hypothetical protein
VETTRPEASSEILNAPDTHERRNIEHNRIFNPQNFKCKCCTPLKQAWTWQISVTFTPHTRSTTK